MDWWEEIAYFQPEEFDSGTPDGGKMLNSGRLNMDEGFVRELERLRRMCSFSININSGYRTTSYNDYIGATQTHASGKAADIGCSHTKAFIILQNAFKCGFTGIGICQKGNRRFIHLDTLDDGVGRPRPHIWSY